MLKLAAYADRLSIRPGATIRFHVANDTGVPVSARLVRVISADPNPEGPGVQLEPLSHAPKLINEPVAQTVPIGSYGRIEQVGSLLDAADGSGSTLTCRVMPTLDGKEQCVMSVDTTTKAGPALVVTADGALELRVGSQQQRLAGLPLRQWSLLWLRYSNDEQLLEAGWLPCHRQAGGKAPRRRNAGSGPPSTGALELRRSFWTSKAGITLAAQRDAQEADRFALHFNGRLEQLCVFDEALTSDELFALAGPNADAGIRAQGHWDFARDTHSLVIRDIGPFELDGQLFNTPGRAMAGSHWDGRFMHAAAAPEHYGAIHFHDDDLDDCRWPVCYEWKVPAGCRSGTYALWLDADGHHDNVPFYVVPAKKARKAPIAVLASTFTYCVYGNNARPEWQRIAGWPERWRQQSADWNAYPYNPGDHPEYGLSTYNVHHDGAGISIVSWHRPMLNMRVGYMTFPDPSIRASGLRHFPADTHLTAWLEHQGYEFDIITDAELHSEGIEVLRDYRVVLTGSHPEYHTRAMLSALTEYRDGGGRLCYLGGNGFYWKIALSPDIDGVIEIRRGEGGIRAWASEPGEYYNQFDGEYGGLWRRNGRPPQQLCGVGFSAQGNFSGSHYRLTEQAKDPRVAWMFKGVAGPVVGGHGLSAHGAAGFELDRYDATLGSPANALVVARSENHPPEAPWVLVPEEMLTPFLTLSNEPAADLIRADMTFFSLPSGGAVFSTGSITFCGSLPSNQFDNDISTLLRNVVDRFLDPAPFTEDG